METNLQSRPVASILGHGGEWGEARGNLGVNRFTVLIVNDFMGVSYCQSLSTAYLKYVQLTVCQLYFSTGFFLKTKYSVG